MKQKPVNFFTQRMLNELNLNNKYTKPSFHSLESNRSKSKRKFGG